LDNTFLGYIGSCYDITEIKNNELSLIELNATKDKFFSIIAHDLKSPFYSIIGLSEHLVKFVKEKEYEKIGEFADIILQSSNRVMDLLTNLMEWSQLQSGRMDFNPVHFDIVSLIREVTLLLKDTAEQKSIILENTLPANVHITADKEMISTVLRNLISNALKFTPTGGKILISAVTGQNEVTIIVQDNGVGISKDRIDKLFNITESYSTPGTQKEKGTGLGLILCKEFIEKNNGKIWVESEVGIGSSFCISLPTSVGSV
jgi:signal transduction histidine kinase